MDLRGILEDAITLHKQGRVQKAAKAYETVLMYDFDNLDAIYLLGTIFLQQKQLGLAAQLLMRVVMMDGSHFEAWNNLGNCFKAVNKEDKAKDCWEAALKIEGKDSHSYADIHNNIGTIYVNNGNPEEGIPHLEKALALKPEHGDANWNMALMQLELGKYKKGFELYKSGFQTQNRLYRNYGEGVRDWQGEEGVDIVVWGEQGIGDEILFASMIPDLQKKVNKVIFDCHPRLMPIFKASFPDIYCEGTRKDEYVSWPSKHPGITHKLAIGDLGRFFRTSIEDFPQHDGYLVARKDRVKHYKNKLKKLGNKLKVGISWTGGYMKTRTDYRSIDLEQWKKILNLDADFISLQYTPDAYEAVADIEDRFDTRVHHWPSAVQNQDYHETAALVDALDLVITVNTAAHHLAGAMGKECWTLTPITKAWRYWSPDEKNEVIPWYPSVKQYQQNQLGNWQPVMSRVADDLKKKIAAHKKQNGNKVTEKVENTAENTEVNV
jgi:tetratricopeptide (TPR) repeat protein